ncbi:MAG: NAD(P)-dependent oxidoreductase [Pseudomonadota bacterium]
MSATSRPTIGFVGVGDMGGPMACNLVKAGFEVIVFDIDTSRSAAVTAAGAALAQDATDVANRAAVVFACLNSVEGMRSVAAAVSRGSAVRVYADLSTAGPSLAEALRDHFNGTSIRMLDAPISGQIERAVDATLAIMVSGSREAFEFAKPAFDAMGQHVFYLGDVAGGGQMMKVANNLINNVQAIATSEAILMGMKFGLDPEQMFAVLNVSTGRNSQTEGNLKNAVLNDNFALGADLSISQKDISLAVAEAERAGVHLPTGRAAAELIADAYAHGPAGQRSSAIFKHVARKSGVEVKSS